jgi:ketoreductase RED2
MRRLSRPDQEGYEHMGLFDGRIALVTGSTSGIGRGIADHLSRQGAIVVLNSRSAAPDPVRLSGASSDALHIPGDVADEADVLRMVASVEEAHGGLDILINNAGTTKFVDFDDLDGIEVADWRRILDVNVIGAWNTVKAAAPLLRRSDLGAVVNVSSMAGIRVTGSCLPYSVSKAALNQLTRTLAKALGPDIRVNAVAPGFIDTPWTADYGDRREEVIDLTPLNRVGTADDVAEAVAMLIASSYVTGEIVTVDGGLSLNN